MNKETQRETEYPTSLADILDSSELILIDGSINSTESFLPSIYDARTFSGLDLDLLENETDALRLVIEFLRNPNVFTIPEITQESRGYHEGIQSKIEFLAIRERELKKPLGKVNRNYKKFKKQKWNNSDRKNRKRQALEDLSILTQQLTQGLERSELRIQDPRYQPLVDMVTFLSKELDLKNPTKDHYYDNVLKNPYNSNVDEKLIATAYLIALNSVLPLKSTPQNQNNGNPHNNGHSKNTPLPTIQKSITIMTADGDLKRLLGVTPGPMASPEFSPYNGSFRRAIKEHKFMFHFGATNYYTPQKEFEIHLTDTPFRVYRGKTQQQSNQIRNQLADMWRDFARAYTR
ncbi:hypothetical protein HOD75_01235 [archaeon]|jgi:hypothetical protein|nr:hypothetical protein [archaeon]MBT4241502.1 hypothetical protein [archaeon]MBT4417627.1 hypothetical protein [archaeon]